MARLVAQGLNRVAVPARKVPQVAGRDIGVSRAQPPLVALSGPLSSAAVNFSGSPDLRGISGT
jgi:hypothetical protein